MIGCKGGLKNSCRGRLCEQRLFSGINGLSILCQKEDLAFDTNDMQRYLINILTVR